MSGRGARIASWRDLRPGGVLFNIAVGEPIERIPALEASNSMAKIRDRTG